jgi:FkbM family methyltransferase
MIPLINLLVKLLLGNKSIEKISFLDKNGSKVISLAPTDSLITAFKDVIIYEVYDKLNIPEKLNLILDVGSHVGFYALKYASTTNRVVCLEPNPLNYSLLCLNVKLNKLYNVTNLNVALWKERGEVLMIFERNSVAHHITTRPNNAKSVSCHKVQSIAIGDLISMFGDIDVLKIDIEGAEYDVIPSLDKIYLDRIKSIIMELHSENYEANLMIKEVLQRAGFRVFFTRPSPHITDVAKVFANIFYTTDSSITLKMVLSVLTLFSLFYKHKIKILYACKNPLCLKNNTHSHI